MLLFKGDSIDENRENVEIIFNLLQFPLQFNEDIEFKIVADFKLLSFIVGLHQGNSRYCCPYCQVSNLLMHKENIFI